jgi:hypothetical protein
MLPLTWGGATLGPNFDINIGRAFLGRNVDANTVVVVVGECGTLVE